MALFANTANKSRMNSLGMARRSNYKSATQRRVDAKIKKSVARSRQMINRKSKVAKQTYTHEDFRLSQYNRNLTYTHEESRLSQYNRKNNQSREQMEWMYWRNTKDAVFDLLTPEARRRLMDAGVNVKVSNKGATGQAQYSPFDIFGMEKTVTVRPGMEFGADEIRHELTHAGLDVAPDLFPLVTAEQKFANSALGTFMGQTNFGWSAGAQMKAAESPAITMGGGSAYPGFTPSNKPEDFSQFFDTKKDSWQYWNIGK